VVQEVSELERIQDRTDRTQRLEGLGLLTLGLAHDLNNILAPALFVGPLLRTSTSPEELARYVDSLEISAQRGASLVRQIMALAQGGSSIRRPATIRHIVRDAITSLESVVPRNIRIEPLLPIDSWPAEINPTQIYQVTINLCRNACDAMPEGGTLRVELSNHVLPSAQVGSGLSTRSGPWLCLAVTDTGTGIQAAVLERIWEPFFSTKQAGHGTGLGLPGVRGIVDEHGGFVEVQSAGG
jgi:signal transduction histidine kinase